MVIRSESERRRAEKQIGYLQSELEKIPASEREDEVTSGVISGLRMQISDIESQLAVYNRLKEGIQAVLTADSFDDIGELVIKARIARGWSQADLAKALDMEPQQVQRYERYDWEKISLWRLQEVVEALRLRVDIHAYLTQEPNALWSEPISGTATTASHTLPWESSVLSTPPTRESTYRYGNQNAVPTTRQLEIHAPR